MKGCVITKNKLTLKRKGTPWNKGKKMSLEYRLSHVGHQLFQTGHIPWNKGKRYSSLTRREASTCVSRNGFKGQEWKRLVLERDNYTCQECGRTDRNKIHAHHIVPFDESIELRFVLSNGKTLCTTCHNKIHGFQIGEGYWTGKKRDVETIEKIRASKIGIPLTEEHKQKLRDVKKLNPTNSGSFKKGQSSWNKGKSPSTESRARMSAAQKKRFSSETTWNKGKKLSKEHCKKISDAHKKLKKLEVE